MYRKKIPHSIYAEAKGVGILKYPPTVCMAMLAKAGKVSPTSPNSYANILMPEKTEQYRIIDLSKEAANKLGVLHGGTANVNVRAI